MLVWTSEEEKGAGVLGSGDVEPGETLVLPVLKPVEPERSGDDDADVDSLSTAS